MQEDLTTPEYVKFNEKLNEYLGYIKQKPRPPKLVEIETRLINSNAIFEYGIYSWDWNILYIYFTPNLTIKINLYQIIFKYHYKNEQQANKNN